MKSKSKFVMESLEEFINENVGSITPQEFESQLSAIINSGAGPAEIYEEIKSLFDQYPEVHSELGEVPDHDKFVEAIEPMKQWWNNLSDEELEEINTLFR